MVEDIKMNAFQEVEDYEYICKRNYELTPMNVSLTGCVRGLFFV